MSLTNPDPLVSTTIPATDISGAGGAKVYEYTATKACRVTIEVYLAVAGGGEYSVWLTKQWAGAGAHHEVAPKTAITPTSTDLSFTLEMVE